ncbi:magnesium chelatase, partial [Mesorhizobium sp. M00.F.Ca.ET.186.01.1.1]
RKQEEKQAPVYSLDDILAQRRKLQDVVVDDSIFEYITTLIRKTRETKRLLLGASSRAGIAVLMASKAWALLDGREYVTPDDVKMVARPALRHRLILSPQVELEGGTS